MHMTIPQNHDINPNPYVERYKESKKVTIVGIIINTLLAILKVLFGIVGSSPALFADGIHSFSDLLSDIVVLIAAKYASKDEDESHPYGHERLETLATIILSAVLIGIGVMIVYQAIAGLFAYTIYTPDNITIYVAIFSILANEFIFRYTINTANKIDSDLLRANAWHSRSDMWSSVIVLIGLIATIQGVFWMDAVAATIVGYMITKMGIKWGYRSIEELVDKGVDLDVANQIKEIIANTEGVIDFHGLRSRKMAGKIVLDIHVLIDKNATASEGHYIAEKVRSNIAFNINNIKEITIHIDIYDHEEQFISSEMLPPSRKVIIKKINTFIKKNELNSKIMNCNTMIFYHQNKIEIYLLFNKLENIKYYQKVFKNFSIKNCNNKIKVVVFSK